MRVLNCVLIMFLLLSTLIACSDSTDNVDSANTKLSVYKNPECGCCDKWITHLENSGFQTDTHYLDAPEVNELKSKITNISKYLSCHTGVYQNKYIFEGHIPAKFITQFLSEFSPYDILLIRNNGTHEVYAHIDNYEQQF